MTGLVCRGLSTREIGDRLYVTTNTVQDHLTAIVTKTGAGAVARLLEQQYL